MSENKRLVLVGVNTRYAYVVNETDRTLLRISVVFNGTWGETKVVLSGFQNITAIAVYNETATVAYTNSGGLQVSQFLNPDTLEQKLVTNGRVGNVTVSDVISLAGVPNGPLYFITTLRPGVRGLIRLSGQIVETLLTDLDAPQGEMQRMVASGPLLYLVQKVSDGRLFTYKVFPVPVGAPHITAITNAASFATATNLAPGTWMTLWGDLANSTEHASTAPFPTTLGGVRVFVTSSSGDKEAPLHFVSPNQVNFLVPDIEGTATRITVNREGISNTSSSLGITSSFPGIFQVFDPNARTLVQDSQYRLLAPGEPLVCGEYYLLWGTGLGSTTPFVPINEFAPPGDIYLLLTKPRLLVGSSEMEIVYAGLSPGAVSLYQVNFQNTSCCTGTPTASDARLVLGDGQTYTFKLMVR
ncbi:MAG: hypothetical protein EXQ56_01900 [Acidobacteria bacterium]|nr:hypothetical protein [Acidobacteriota bacterium]